MTPLEWTFYVGFPIVVFGHIFVGWIMLGILYKWNKRTDVGGCSHHLHDIGKMPKVPARIFYYLYFGTGVLMCLGCPLYCITFPATYVMYRQNIKYFNEVKDCIVTRPPKRKVVFVSPMVTEVAVVRM